MLSNLKGKKLKYLKGLTLTIFILVSTIHNASAAIIEVLPTFGGGNSIESNAPQFGNVWTGVNQSFTAVDANIKFGFYWNNFSDSESIIYTLREGDGNMGDVVATRSATITSTITGTPELFEVDFSSISLLIGQHYTMGVSLAQKVLGVGEKANSSAVYAGVDNNLYAGGQFYYSGSAYDNNFPLRDIAFRMTGVDANGGAVSVSQPSISSLFIICLFGMFGFRKFVGNSIS